MKIEYGIVLNIVADFFMKEETDLKEALVKHTGVYAKHCLFNLSQSGKLLKYKNRISIVYDSYKQFTENIEKDIQFYVQRDLGNNDGWFVQANIESASFGTQEV